VELPIRQKRLYKTPMLATSGVALVVLAVVVGTIAPDVARHKDDVSLEDAQRTVQERLAYNEASYRTLNEGIQRGHADDPSDRQVGFRCECARLGCNAIVLLTKAGYEAVRGDGRRFFMLDGHELPEIEDVVERREGYVVVEKRAHAGETAEAVDPRA
jgi:hypothetical protein